MNEPPVLPTDGPAADPSHRSALDAADGALLDAVRALRWPARRRVRTGLAGEHLSRALGGSAEFSEYRGYRQGDDPRRIDWKLFARSDRVFIRLSQDRMVLPTTIVVDASKSMAYPTTTLEKWEFARQVVLGLAAVTHQGGDPVGLVVVSGNGASRVPPRTRRGVVQEVAHALRPLIPSGSLALAPAMVSLGSMGRVVIVSDFLGDAEALLQRGAELAARGRELYAIHVLHQNEVDPPHRTMLVVDPEQADLRRPLTEETRRRYLASFNEWRAGLAHQWRSAGATYTQVISTEGPANAVRRIVRATDAR